MSEPDLETDMDYKTVRDIILSFLNRYEYLYEKRIQKLIFYSEVYCLVNFFRRLTKATFKPYYWGSYSEDIAEILKWMDDKDIVPTKTVIVHGKKVTQYQGNGREPDLDEEIEIVIARVHSKTRYQSTDELAEFSKQNWLFENTPYDMPMNFRNFLEEFGEEEIQKRYQELEDDFSDESVSYSAIKSKLVDVGASETATS